MSWRLGAAAEFSLLNAAVCFFTNCYNLIGALRHGMWMCCKEEVAAALSLLIVAVCVFTEYYNLIGALGHGMWMRCKEEVAAALSLLMIVAVCVFTYYYYLTNNRLPGGYDHDLLYSYNF